MKIQKLLGVIGFLTFGVVIVAWLVQIFSFFFIGLGSLTSFVLVNLSAIFGLLIGLFVCQKEITALAISYLEKIDKKFKAIILFTVVYISLLLVTLLFYRAIKGEWAATDVINIMMWGTYLLAPVVVIWAFNDWKDQSHRELLRNESNKILTLHADYLTKLSSVRKKIEIYHDMLTNYNCVVSQEELLKYMQELMGTIFIATELHFLTNKFLLISGRSDLKKIFEDSEVKMTSYNNSISKFINDLFLVKKYNASFNNRFKILKDDMEANYQPYMNLYNQQLCENLIPFIQLDTPPNPS